MPFGELQNNLVYSYHVYLSNYFGRHWADDWQISLGLDHLSQVLPGVETYNSTQFIWVWIYIYTCRRFCVQ